MTERGMPPPADLPETTVSELHALYRAGAASEPGAQLDQNILAAARADLRAAGASAARRHRPWWKAWLKPASVMAVAVLGLSLTWQVIDEQERDRRHEIGSARDQPKTADTAGQGAAAPPPGAAAPVNIAPAPAVAERAPAPADQPARARRQAAEPAAAAAPQAFPAQEEAGKSKAGATSGSVAQPARAPLPALPATPAEKKNLRAGDARAKDERGDAAASGSAPAADKREAEGRVGPSAAEADALGKAAPAAATPQAWLQQIRELRAAGREAEAAQSLARFRVSYPDFVVPDDLKPLK
jgi:hypothetical protein